jgi:hypothetical protein
MAVTFSKQTYKGAGRIFAREYEATTPGVDLGNITQLDQNTESESASIPNKRTTAGGAWDEDDRVISMGIEIITSDFTTLVNKIGWLSEATVIAAATITDEPLGLAGAGFLPFEGAMTSVSEVAATNGDGAAARIDSTPYSLNAYLQPAVANTFYYKVTTQGTTGASPPVFPTVAGATVVDGTATLTCMGRIILTAVTDFEFSPAGIILASDASMTTGEQLKYTGARPAQVSHEALQAATVEYELFFEGLNAADASRPVPRRYYRVKLNVTEAMPVIADDYSLMSIKGKILPNAEGKYVKHSQVGG